jgi:chemotaxis regulatin CheY-phosphate phosphatase CheZ
LKPFAAYKFKIKDAWKEKIRTMNKAMASHHTSWEDFSLQNATDQVAADDAENLDENWGEEWGADSSAVSDVARMEAGLHTLANVIVCAQEDVMQLRHETGIAAGVIMTAVEDLLADERFSTMDADGALSARLIAILEACSFQDIVGQRMARVTEALEDAHRRCESGVMSNTLSAEEQERENRKSERIAFGPAQDASGFDQNSIDSLFD